MSVMPYKKPQGRGKWNAEAVQCKIVEFINNSLYTTNSIYVYCYIVLKTWLHHVYLYKNRRNRYSVLFQMYLLKKYLIHCLTSMRYWYSYFKTISIRIFESISDLFFCLYTKYCYIYRFEIISKHSQDSI